MTDRQAKAYALLHVKANPYNVGEAAGDYLDDMSSCGKSFIVIVGEIAVWLLMNEFPLSEVARWVKYMLRHESNWS